MWSLKSVVVLLAAALAFSSATADNVAPIVRKVLLPPIPHPDNANILPIQPIDDAAWIWHPDFGNSPAAANSDRFSGGWREPVVLRFRKQFDATTSPLRIHVSADERFELFLDGQRIARGPDRSDVEHWSYATYDIQLSPGTHRFEAVAWSIGPNEPAAQLSWRGGFVLKAEGDYDAQLTTGKAAWEVAKLDGYSFGNSLFVGAPLTVHDSGMQWKERIYVPATIVRAAIKGNIWGEVAAGWKLLPTTLPDQIDREITTGRAMALGEGPLTADTPIPADSAKSPDLPKWQTLLDGKGDVVVPAHTEQYLLWDLQNYYTAYPLCEVSGGAGATINWGWAESLYLPHSDGKGQRDEFIGKTFRGNTDTFLPGGADHAKFTTLWWRAGRWCLISIKTADQPITLHRLALNESRYPVENESSFDGGDPDLPAVLSLCVRGMQMDMHETYMDCPYYEQLEYDGDSRIELLTTYAITHDDRLAKHALELYDDSRHNTGFVAERYPSFIPQQAATFSMIWALMVNDYAYWRNDPDFVKARAIGLRTMLDHFDAYVNKDGLLENLPGWSFMDWVPQWTNGVAPDGVTGVSADNNLLYVYALKKSAEVEDYLGEPLLAQRLRDKADRTAAAIRAKFWDESRGLIADNLAHTEFSEHAQCLALLSDTLTGDQAKRCFQQLLTAPDLKRASIYFSFYLMETWQKFGRGDLIVERMAFWKDLVKQGLKTPVEAPGDTRSDCHAWGSHPLFDLQASVAGVRPASPGFRTIRIAPQPGKLPKIISHLPHPNGFINLNLTFNNGRCQGTVELPEKITGTFVWGTHTQPLTPGPNQIDLSP